MYSCPSDDIHSVYIDGELPLSYVADYESHIKTCQSCQEKLSKLRAIKNTFKKDSSTIFLSESYKQASFERLQTKMRYAQNTARTENTKTIQFSQVKWVAGAVAAVLIAAIVPVSLINNKKTGNASYSEIASTLPITRVQEESIPEQNVIIDRNKYGSLAQTVGTRTISNSQITGMDVLRPDFDDNNKLRIKITMPGFDDSSQEEIDIRLPVNSYFGQLK